MADAFFRVFDEDKSGALSFYEYMLVKTAPKLETQEDRLGWIFHAFDSDGGGSIDNTEVTVVYIVYGTVLFQYLFCFFCRFTNWLKHFTECQGRVMIKMQRKRSPIVLR